MKKFVVFVLTLSIILTFLSLNVYSEKTISVYLDNEKLEFDVNPKIVNDRTMVPMRIIFEKLGAEVTWDESTKTAHAFTYNYDIARGVSITIGAPNMRDAYDTSIKLDAPAIIDNGRTLVPLRAISEAFGCTVQWNAETNTVIIFSENFIDYSKTQPQTTVQVATPTEFLNAIDSNKKIILTSNYYNLSDVTNIDNPFIENSNGSYIIKNIINTTIEGNAEIVINDIYADVLTFKKCGNINLSNLSIGHSNSLDSYKCEGAVVKFDTCEKINLSNCILYGCGAFGIYADKTKDINITDCKIYDCSYTSIWLTYQTNATVYTTEFCDSTHSSGFLRIDHSSSIQLTDCNIHDIICNDFGYFIETFDRTETASTINLKNCVIKNNFFENITNQETKNLTFDNCIFDNNNGNMEHSSVVYTNSTTQTIPSDTSTTSEASDNYSSSDNKSLFLQYVELGIKCQTNSIKNLTSYISSNFDETFKTLFFENLRIGYDSINNAYQMSLIYSDMNNLSQPLLNILNTYQEIFDGKYSPSTMSQAFTKATKYYKEILDKTNIWIQ